MTWPDQYVAGSWRSFDEAKIARALRVKPRHDARWIVALEAALGRRALT